MVPEPSAPALCSTLVASAATRLREAFQDARYSETVATFDPAIRDVLVELRGATRWASAPKVGEELARPLRLTDAVWGPVPTTAKG